MTRERNPASWIGRVEYWANAKKAATTSKGRLGYVASRAGCAGSTVAVVFGAEAVPTVELAEAFDEMILSVEPGGRAISLVWIVPRVTVVPVTIAQRRLAFAGGGGFRPGKVAPLSFRASDRVRVTQVDHD